MGAVWVWGGELIAKGGGPRIKIVSEGGSVQKKKKKKKKKKVAPSSTHISLGAFGLCDDVTSRI